MAKPTGFLEYNREEVPYRPVEERLKDYFEVEVPLSAEAMNCQSARCMDCGIPYCHSMGCPLNNRIPEFNDCVYKGRWKDACDILHSTNNFPEVTGRVCPAPCEAACTLNIDEAPVLIRHIEDQIVEKGFEEGWIKPLIAEVKTGKRVAIVGSGPAGLAAAQQLARMGHDVVVFEKDNRIGGLLRYGIPDFKLDKRILDRRLEQMAAEGVQFQTEVNVGEDISPHYLDKMFDAVCLTMGATVPRDLQVEGRELKNVHYAMEFLKQQNKRIAGETIDPSEVINAKDKVVVVIGGGDTGSDCVGTSNRQGAKEVHQFEILPQPPQTRPIDTPWPNWPRVLRTSSSHKEGCLRRWCILTKKLTGKDGAVTHLHGIEVEWSAGPKGHTMKEIPGTEFSMKADLVLLAMGFLYVQPAGLIDKMGLKLDQRGNVMIKENYMTSKPGVFASGDTTTGASLVVRAIDFGRKMAKSVDQYLREQV